ncbi:MAG: GNAT family N-acetyltransferase [Roseibium sp.]|uniref:GNAT family N-acetyltransferase n=1 Tax=Roseibium sp. TaxID=1936156 RepID=UPI003296CD8A
MNSTMFAKSMETDRLCLRPVIWRDFWFYCRLMSHPDVRRHLGGPVTWRRWYSRFRQHLTRQEGSGAWVVTLTGSGGALGLVELTPHKDGKDWEVSYQFRPSSWGQGMAREAVSAAIKHGLEDVGLARIVAETQSANTASCRLLGRLGLVESHRVHRFGAEQIIFTTQPNVRKKPLPGT